MKGTDLARALTLLLKPRTDVALNEALNLVRIAFGEEPLTDKRARAGRAGGARSAEVRRSVHGSAQPKQTRSKPEARVEAPPEANTEASSKQNVFASAGASAEPRLARKQDPNDIPGFSGSGSDISEPPFAPVRRRRHELPDDWTPKDRHRFFCGEHGLDAAERGSAFRSHHKARGTRLLDWDAEFDVWLTNARSFVPTRREKPPGLVEHEARMHRNGSDVENPGRNRKPQPLRRDVAPMPLGETLAAIEGARAALGAPKPVKTAGSTPPAAAGVSE